MALKDRLLRAVGRPSEKNNDRSSISSGSTGGKHSGTTTPTNGTTEHISPLTTIKTAVEPSTNKPEITLTKTHSRLGKTLTWGSSNSHGEKKSKQEIAKEKQLKQWAKSDDVEWTSPMSHRPGRKDQGCQNTLRAFDFQQAAVGRGDRNKSVCSGVSPSGSRANSLDLRPSVDFSSKRLSSGGIGHGKLSQEINRDDKENAIVEPPKPQHMAGVREE